LGRESLEVSRKRRRGGDPWKIAGERAVKESLKMDSREGKVENQGVSILRKTGNKK